MGRVFEKVNIIKEFRNKFLILVRPEGFEPQPPDPKSGALSS